MFVQGQHISLAQQIEQVTDTVQQFIVNIGEDATTDLISNSLFYISIGSNDFIHYYLLNASNVQNVYLPWSFNQFLAQTIKQEIKVQSCSIQNLNTVFFMQLPSSIFCFHM